MNRGLQELGRPVIVLIGGTTGTGKSTVASEVAYRLGITRVTSTDFLRQTMRAFLTPELMPSIHTSSFEGDPLIPSFVEQTRNVLVAVNAAIERALQEGWSMVLEGVHLVPGLVPVELEDALVMQCVLTIDDETDHADHFWVRDAVSGGVRPVARYLEHLSDIRRIQDFIVEEADRVGVPVVENTGMEHAVVSVTGLVLTAAMERLEHV